METPSIIEFRDNIYEEIKTDINEDTELFDQLFQDLCETGYLECCACPSDDSIFMYKARSGLKWSDVAQLSDPIKKKILLQVIQNPKCFFVLFNTQKGKLKIIGDEISSWRSLPNKRPVAYLVVDNDRTLSEQSVNGLFNCFPIREGQEHSTDLQEKYDVRIFELSSNNKVSLSDINTYIDAYAYNPAYPMPLIVVLANNKQIDKLVSIVYKVIHHSSSSLCIGGGWDEADKTYPIYRDKPFSILGESITFRMLLNHPSERLFRNGFVTATEGDLLDEEYDECANAFHYPVEINPEDTENYFSFHHPEAKIHHVKVRSQESNNVIAKRILLEKWQEHFSIPLRLQDGSLYHHKVIINSDSRAAEMEEFARERLPFANVITFNMRGVKLYTQDRSVKTYSARKQNLNQLLFYIYKMNHLEDRPLIILGRRKVDRGLGFHYAPRRNRKPILTIEGKDGQLETDGKEGLIWTDMIMGNKIEHIPTAVQKAGRGAGIIRQCPQYPSEFHYWIDAETSKHILRHYQKVDKVNELRGTNSMLQAVTHANALLPIVRQNHEVDPSTFRVIKGTSPQHTLELTKEIVKDVFLKENYRSPSLGNGTNGDPRFYVTSLNTGQCVVSVIDAVKKVPGAYGTNGGQRTYRRFMPSYKDLTNEETLHVVIPLIDPSYTSEMKAKLDREFAAYFVTIPQEGEF